MHYHMFCNQSFHFSFVQNEYLMKFLSQWYVRIYGSRIKKKNMWNNYYWKKSWNQSFSIANMFNLFRQSNCSCRSCEASWPLTINGELNYWIPVRFWSVMVWWHAPFWLNIYAYIPGVYHVDILMLLVRESRALSTNLWLTMHLKMRLDKTSEFSNYL